MVAARAGAALQPLVQGADLLRRNLAACRPIDLREQGQALLVRFQHGVNQARRAGWRFLLDLGHAGARGHADVAAIDGNVACDRLQQGRLARAVTADQPDAAAGIDRQVRPVQQRAPAHPQHHSGDRQQAHGVQRWGKWESSQAFRVAI